MLKLIPLQNYISNMGKKARNAGTKKKYTVEYWNKHPEFRLVEYEKKKFNLSDEDIKKRLVENYEKLIKTEINDFNQMPKLSMSEFDIQKSFSMNIFTKIEEFRFILNELKDFITDLKNIKDD